MGDSNFDGSVVLILLHEPGGAFGLVLNDPILVDPAEQTPLVAWMDHATSPRTVFRGGPVELDGVLCLADVEDVAAEGIRPILGRLALIDMERRDLAATLTRRFRLFAGHSGWGPGQLDDEVRGDFWLIADLAPDDVFTPLPERLWSSVLRRQGGPFAQLATWTSDAHLN